MKRIPFEARAFWELNYVLDVISDSPRDRRRKSRWLRDSNVIDKRQGCGPVVTRTALERSLPWVLDTLERYERLGTIEYH